MTDYFRTVGFTLERDELESLLARAIGNGTSTAAPHGEYRSWTPGAGAELWLTMKRRNDGALELAGVNPHFASDARLSAVIEGAERHAEFPLEGEIFAWASRDGEEHGLYPFSASVPDYDAALASRLLPFRATLAVAAFAHELRCWPDAAAYAADGDDAMAAFAKTSFVPTGLFGNNVGRKRSQNVVMGTITASELRHNPATERAFRVLRLRLHGGEIDVVASPDLLAGDPPLGGIARATCWLTARFTEPLA